MWRAVNRWFEENRWAGDAALAGTLLVLLTSIAPLGWGGYGRAGTFTVLLVLPLFARRTYPLAVLLITIGLCLIQVAIWGEPVAGDAVVPIVVHAAAAYIDDRRWGYAGLAAGLVGAGVGALRWGMTYYRYGYGIAPSAMLSAVLAGWAVVIAAFLWGVRQRDRRERAAEQVVSLAERNRLLTAERDTRVEMGAAAERARIARELHDIVAHSLSVIVVQADGGAAAARSKPEVGPEVLETIAATSRDALAQMRRMVSVLRTGNDGVPGYAPAPGPGDLPGLIDQVRAAGVPVEFDVVGTAREMSPDAGLAIYRAVQESLTNVLKHGGPAATCRVVLHYGPSEAVITVTDDGRGAAASFEESDGASALSAGAGAAASGASGLAAASAGAMGHGLEGMRERVALQGGSLHAGPRIGGGFEVTAAIPYADADGGTALAARVAPESPAAGPAGRPE